MANIDKVLRKYIDRSSTDEEILESAKLELLSSMSALDYQLGRLAEAVDNRIRPRRYAPITILNTNEVERTIAEQMEVVRCARQIKAAPGTDIKQLYAVLDRVERKCAVLRAAHRDLCR